MSPLNKRKSLLSLKTGSDITKRKIPAMYNTDIAASIRENTIRDSLLLKNPVVILQRLPNILTRESQKIFNTIVDNNSLKILESSSTRVRLNNKKNVMSPSNLSLKFSTPRTKQQRWKGNSTPYDLIEPETPTLQRQLRKRQNKKDNRTNSNVKETRKTIGVHIKTDSSDLNRTRTRIPVLQTFHCLRKKVTEESNDRMVAIKENKNFKCTTLSPSRRKSMNSMNIKSHTPSARLRGKSKINTTPLNATVKKLDLKNSATKKLPNFAELHKKLFAKSESVVDARKRLEERHRALTTTGINNLPISNLITKINSLPCNSKKNQFRLKVRMKDATNCILKKQPIVNPISSRSKCQQQNREFLKGVRTNRRFELQMKSRNMNL
ncbi:uncharacterized protein LOC143360866 [Halictus rubicundus]|uniref:uncharacterized protein LOC143360866 n=1 Tax=Halictus rubicundus TaxID=77578 RepID=UPI0040353497